MIRYTEVFHDKSLNCGYAFTNDGIRFLFDMEFAELVKSRGWHLSKRGYIAGKEKRRETPLHKLMIHVDSKMDIDHINGDKTDNRKSNLRVCTHQQNMFNQKLRATNTSGYMGVSYSKTAKKYEAYVHNSGKKHKAGYYSTPIEAAVARDKLAKELFGKYASLNFPESLNG